LSDVKVVSEDLSSTSVKIEDEMFLIESSTHDAIGKDLSETFASEGFLFLLAAI
jgi:hypothetical protein